MSKIGRPSKYNKEILAEAEEYLNFCQENKTMPFIEELALRLDINDDTIVEWAEIHDEFSATIKRLKIMQKLHLKQDALERKIHPAMAIFLLKANHGLTEKHPEQSQPIHFTMVTGVPIPLADIT